MPLLKTTFENLGLTKVVTYINSGNVIFVSNAQSPANLVKEIEAAIIKDFGFTVSVIVKSREDIVRINNTVPASWANDAVQKTDVMFLWGDIDTPQILQQVACDPLKETLIYCDGALLWNVARENITKGAVIKLVKSDVYKKMTIRNINTVRKITELMAEADRSGIVIAGALQ